MISEVVIISYDIHVYQIYNYFFLTSHCVNSVFFTRREEKDFYVTQIVHVTQITTMFRYK